MKKSKSKKSSNSFKRTDIRLCLEWSHVLLIFFLILLSFVGCQSLAFAQDTEPLVSANISDVGGVSGNTSGKGFYPIGPQDILSISVWKDELLSRDVTVRPDGRISFPLIGEVVAEGRHVAEVTQEINDRLSKFVSDPRVTVAVAEVKSYKIYVIGKVKTPGEFLLGQNTDVMQALSLGRRKLRLLQGKVPFAYCVELAINKKSIHLTIRMFLRGKT